MRKETSTLNNARLGARYIIRNKSAAPVTCYSVEHPYDSVGLSPTSIRHIGLLWTTFVSLFPQPSKMICGNASPASPGHYLRVPRTLSQRRCPHKRSYISMRVTTLLWLQLFVCLGDTMAPVCPYQPCCPNLTQWPIQSFF